MRAISRMRPVAGRASQLMCGAAAAAIFAAHPAQAQTAAAKSAPTTQIEEIVVTGTNIRGQAPVGEPITNLSRTVIDQTAAVSVQQLLSTAAPQVNGFGSAGQTSGSFEPRLRSLGGSSSAATLVLIDGHRIAPGGGVAFTADPNIVPADAIERVEILADGASAVYGSDAVAGVINIITRKNYNGASITAQAGFGNHYNTEDTSALFGRTWEGGGFIASYEFSHRSNLPSSARSWVSGNQSNSGPGATGAGGANFNTMACAPATAQVGSTYYAAPYTGAGQSFLANINGLCSVQKYLDLLPESTSHRLYLSAHQDFGRVHLAANLLYSNSWQTAAVSRGTATNVSVYGPGSTPPVGASINPFFQGPPGATSETINYDFNGLFGSGAKQFQTQDNVMGTLQADIDLGKGWTGTAVATVADPHFRTTTTGAVSAAAAYLSLNGTNFANASLAQANAIGNTLGTNTVVTRPLNAGNALNVFQSGAAGTSPTVIQSLITGNTFSETERPVYDFVAKANGSLFALPGGDLKMAAGVEEYIGSQTGNSAVASPLGGASQPLDYYNNIVTPTRYITSGFVEFNVPVVGETMNVPLVRRLTLDVAGRIDHYSDLLKSVANPRTPKFGINWEPVKDLTVRGAFGTSFVAPAINFLQLGTPGSTTTSYFANGLAAFTLPAGYPGATSLGCSPTASCTVSSATKVNGQSIDGIQVFGGNPNLVPMTGTDWSVGLDWRPHDFLDGLNVSLTYWGATYRGVITNQSNMTVAANTPGLGSVLVINPTAAQVAAAESGRLATTTLPSNIAFISNIVQQNFFNFEANGLDFDVSYRFDGKSLGVFTIEETGEVKTRFRKQLGSGPWVNALGVENTTNTFSPIVFLGRTDLGWRKAALRADLFVNVVGDYYLTDAFGPFNSSPCPSNVTASGLGCQHVKPYVTLDTHIAYDLPGDGWFTKGAQVYLQINNIADTRSPFVDAVDAITGNGSLNSFANPIGRTVTFGIHKKF